MSGLDDTIDDLQTDVLTIARTTDGIMVDGVYVPNASTTFTVVAVIQPAFNLNRVIGGSNLSARVDDQQSTEVRQLHTRTLLKTRTSSNDPDVVVGFEGANWTVARVEKWVLNDLVPEIHYHVVIERQTGGGS